MVPRKLSNRTYEVWGHAEVLALCSDKFGFCGFRLPNPVLPVLFTVLRHSSQSGEMSGISLQNQWRWLGKWKPKLPGTFPDSHDGYEAMGVAWESSTQPTVVLAGAQLLPGAN